MEYSTYQYVKRDGSRRFTCPYIKRDGSICGKSCWQPEGCSLHWKLYEQKFLVVSAEKETIPGRDTVLSMRRGFIFEIGMRDKRRRG